MATITELPDAEPEVVQSSEDTEKAVEKCLDVLIKAKTDTEVFAALLLVTKLVQAKDTDEARRRKIFDAVGFTFLNRLLKTNQAPEGCDKSIYQSLAITLLACFSTDSALVVHPQMLNKIPVFKDIILDARTSVDNQDQKSIIDDTYQILIAMATQDAGRQQLIQHEMVPTLCEICRNVYYGHDKAFHLMGDLLQYQGETIWQSNVDNLSQLLTNMATDFKQIQDDRKFQLCSHLASFLTSSSDLVPREDATWPWDVHKGLSDIIRSKTGADQRNPALRLASLMVYQLGVTWALGPDGNDKKFVLLLINLACVEVRMGLEDSTQTPNSISILPSCYSILESCIEFMTCGPSLSLDENQVLQLHKAMTGAFGAVMFYLKEIQSEPEKINDPLVRATVRVLSVWLAEETAALREQVYEVLPFVLTVVEKSFEEIQSTQEPSDLEISNPFPYSTPSSIRGDLLRLLLPALCHLTAEQEPRDLLLAQGAMETCGKYFSYQWKQFMEKKDDQPEVALITLCNIFLNVSLQDTQAVKQTEVFAEIYGLIANIMPKLAKQHENLVLSFNMAVLGLTLVKNLASSSTIIDTSESKRFLGAILRMFASSHQHGNSGRCEVTPMYRQHWEDIGELWLLGMQVLSESVAVFPWFASVFLQCDWVTSTLNLLSKISGMDEDVSMMYSSVLCSLGRHSSNVHSTLNKANGLNLARKHNMIELTVVLQTSPEDPR